MLYSSNTFSMLYIKIEYTKILQSEKNSHVTVPYQMQNQNLKHIIRMENKCQKWTWQRNFLIIRIKWWIKPEFVAR